MNNQEYSLENLNINFVYTKVYIDDVWEYDLRNAGVVEFTYNQGILS